jgi:(R,R)-butanediol dehydrogenase/meso-butanediol dehydrogenase/diacetyl reductase
MKAARFHGRGDVRIEQVAEPGRPQPHDIVLDVLAASVCGSDSSEWAHGPLLIPGKTAHPVTGRLGPVTLGHEFVGRVVAVGSAVETFAIGDRVVSGAGVSCGTCEWCMAGRTNLCERYYTLGFHTDGGLAEQVSTPAMICRAVNNDIPDVTATLAQPLAVALHAVHRGGVAPGMDVAVIGAGGIGAFVIAAIADLKPARLIAIDIDDDRLATARALGATHLVNARQHDTVEAIRDLTGGRGAHVVCEASGAGHAPQASIRAARRGGRVVLIGLQSGPRELDLLDATVREVDVVTTLAHVCGHDLPRALHLLENPALAATVIEKVIPLDPLVDEALRPLAEGKARGKIVIQPGLAA